MTTPFETVKELVAELQQGSMHVLADRLAEALAQHEAHISALKARAERAEKALESEKREHAETRAMHSQMCAVALQHQRDMGSARDAALEEAATMFDNDRELIYARAVAAGVRALKSHPARRFVDADALRNAVGNIIFAIRRGLRRENWDGAVHGARAEWQDISDAYGDE